MNLKAVSWLGLALLLVLCVLLLGSGVLLVVSMVHVTEHFLQHRDGREGLVGANGPVYQSLVNDLLVDEDTRWSLGSSEQEATHWLVLDRETRNLYLVPHRPAELFLAQQHPPVTPMGSEDVASFMESMRETLERETRAWREQRVMPCPGECEGGWVKTTDGEYDQCTICGGYGFLVLAEEDAERVSRGKGVPLAEVMLPPGFLPLVAPAPDAPPAIQNAFSTHTGVTAMALDQRDGTWVLRFTEAIAAPPGKFKVQVSTACLDYDFPACGRLVLPDGPAHLCLVGYVDMRQEDCYGIWGGPVALLDGRLCQVLRLPYRNGRPALLLRDVATGENVSHATVNVPVVPLLLPGTTLVPDEDSEYVGVLPALEAAGIVRRTGQTVAVGDLVLNICELLD